RTIQLVQSFRMALQSKSLEKIVAAYHRNLDTSILLTDQERKLLQAAQEFLDAQNNNDDEKLAIAYEAIRLMHSPHRILFSQQEARRGELAQERQKALARFRKALTQQPGVQSIVHSYDSILNGYASLTEQE